MRNFRPTTLVAYKKRSRRGEVGYERLHHSLCARPSMSLTAVSRPYFCKNHTHADPQLTCQCFGRYTLAMPVIKVCDNNNLAIANMGAGSKCGLVWRDPPLHPSPPLSSPPLRSRPPYCS